MQFFPKLLVFLLLSYVVFFFGFLFKATDFISLNSKIKFNPNSSSNFFPIKLNEDEKLPNLPTTNIPFDNDEINSVLSFAEPKTIKSKPKSKATSPKENPFKILKAYSVKLTPEQQEFKKFNQPHHALINDPDYCDIVDLYNLKRPENIFDKKNFATYFPKNQLPRAQVMSKIGQVIDPIPDKLKPKTSHLSPKITSFFMEFSNFHHYHRIGKNFLCATQMYNHIPGQTALTKKDSFLNTFNSYVAKYKTRPQCFNQTTLFPQTFRLYNRIECKKFFTLINSQEYTPFTYMMKLATGEHKGNGVDILDQNRAKKLNSQFKSGKLCGQLDKKILIQKYITNPLLLNFHNKFDFRVYMLIASTNPLIVYFHDGFVRVSLFPYEKTSTSRGSHLTNLHLARNIIQEAKETNTTVNGMTAEEAEDYGLWNQEKLKDYLLQTGKIQDPEWINHFLRPAFHKAMIHLVRMTAPSLWKGSNVYSLQGVDFMLDDNMNLWFLESNASPLLSGLKKYGIFKSVVKGAIEISYGLYKSRMKRVMDVIRRMDSDNKWRKEYQLAVKNRFESEYEVKNNWQLILDENRPGTEAYMNYLPLECL